MCNKFRSNIYIYIYKYILNSIALESIILLELGILSSWKHNIGPNSKVQHWFRHMDPPKKKTCSEYLFHKQLMAAVM